MLRITAGSLKNRRLQSLPGAQTRPTLEKTRAMICNSLAARYDLRDFHLIDLFAGTGALGLELYSWGGGPLDLIEQEAKTYRVLQANLAALGVEKSARLWQADGVRWLQENPLGDTPYLILLDPPYAGDLAERALRVLSRRRAQLAGSLVVVERSKHQGLPPLEGVELFKSRVFGSTVVEFFEVQ